MEEVLDLAYLALHALTNRDRAGLDLAALTALVSLSYLEVELGLARPGRWGISAKGGPDSKGSDHADYVASAYPQ